MEEIIHGTDNTWRTKDDEIIPVSEMSSTHLRNAKYYAQKMQEHYWKLSCYFDEKVDMLDAEAKKRKIKLRDRNTTFVKNTQRWKENINKMEDVHSQSTNLAGNNNNKH